LADSEYVETRAKAIVNMVDSVRQVIP
jgi:hypothetical protein